MRTLPSLPIAVLAIVATSFLGGASPMHAAAPSLMADAAPASDLDGAAIAPVEGAAREGEAPVSQQAATEPTPAPRTTPSLIRASAPSGAAPSPPTLPSTAADIVAAAPAADWAAIDPATLLVLDLPGDRRVVIALAPSFAPAHVANIRALARAGWFDTAVIERVQDDYVTQWGDPAGTHALPSTAATRLPAEYDRAAAGLPMTPLPYPDTFAPRVGFVAGFPVASDGDRTWPVHCYGMVGVGRDVPPDTGTGAELYAVIGHAPRALDRNLAVVGRVVAGMDSLAALPRGTAALGFYARPEERVPFRRVRLASDLPAAERPAFEWLRPESASFRAWVAARAARTEPFFVRTAHAVDLCNALPPVRPVPAR